MTDDEPFSLRREPAPRQATKPEPPQTPPAKQMSLFDAGRNDLPGQALMFPDVDTLPHKANA